MKIDIIGDIHGCFEPFKDLTKKLGYEWDSGFPQHPEGRRLAFVGDLTDRGPHSLKVIEVVYELVVKQKKAYYVPGNHCNKLFRYFSGNKVQITHGLETTVAEYEALSDVERRKISAKFIELTNHSPLYHMLDGHKLVIAHAGIREDFIGKHSGRVKTFVLYGDITGEVAKDGFPVRRDWAASYKGKPVIVYGHTPVKEIRQLNNTYNIDTGCVFGGKLTALKYPEMEIIDVPSDMPLVAEKFR